MATARQAVKAHQVAASRAIVVAFMGAGFLNGAVSMGRPYLG